MSEIDQRVDLPPLDWSELGVSGLLPTGTATLLLADVEGSTRLWETRPEEMTGALARLNQTVSEVTPRSHTLRAAAMLRVVLRDGAMTTHTGNYRPVPRGRCVNRVRPADDQTKGAR